MKKQTMMIFAAAVVLLQIGSLIKITALERQLENVHNAIQSSENRLHSEIDSIYQSVEQKLLDQASLIFDASATLGAPDAAALSVPVTFVVEPKAASERTAIWLDFDGQPLALEKSGLRYTATKSFPIASVAQPKIVVEEDGVLRVEEHPGLNLPQLWDALFPYVSARYSGSGTYSSGVYRLKGRVDIDYKPAFGENRLVDMSYVVTVGDATVGQTPVALDQSAAPALEIDEKYSVEAGQALRTFIIATDSLGFTHECTVIHWIAGEGRQPEPYFDRQKITAPSGEVIRPLD